MTPELSPLRRQAVFDALRRGTVPGHALDVLAVGLEGFERTVGEDLDAVTRGGAHFKAVRGEYGTGKTFFARWLQEQARKRGFATAEVQISETETPLHRLETVYRRAMERLCTDDVSSGALTRVVERWCYVLEEDVIDDGIDETAPEFGEAVEALLEKRLAGISRSTPQFATVLRAWRRARAAGETALAQGLLAWLAGQPNVGASIKRVAGLKGDVDHFGAMSFLAGLLTMLRDAGHGGLVLVLDEVETLQRVRRDVREKSLNALRQLVDEIDGGRFPGLYLVITGTEAFFEGPQGVQRSPPLAQRLAVDFSGDPRFDNPRAPQLRLLPFDRARLESVGRRVRDLFIAGLSDEISTRVERVCDDKFVADLARAVGGQLGGRVGIAPRVFIKKLVAEVLDRIELFPDFDPRRDYQVMVRASELCPAERALLTVDDIEL